MSLTYSQVHRLLAKRRGKASSFQCPCGTPAQGWAYQYTAETPLYSSGGSPYAESIWEDYSPMCSRCHASLDWTSQSRRSSGEATLRANAASAGRLGGAARTEKLRTDEEFAQKARDHGKWLGKTKGSIGGKNRAARALIDPEYAEVCVQAAGKARAAKKKKAEEDPDFGAQLRKNIGDLARITNSRRRRCSECGATYSPPNMGSHQKASGHSGYEEER